MQEKDTLTQNFLKQEELVRAIMADDDSVLKWLYQENYYKTEKYVVENSGSQEQAKDIFQDAFITVWENVKDSKFVPQNQTALNGYIYTVAKNKWLDFLKSSHFKKTKSLEAHTYKIEDKNNTQDEIDANASEEKIAKVVSTFGLIDEACKKILTVFYYENKSLRKIAEELNITEASARNKKYRCLEKLRTTVLKSN